MRPNQLVVFGASGDLTSRKLIPALLRNLTDGAIKQPLQVVGVSRGQRTSEDWRDELAGAVAPEHEGAWQQLAPNLHWHSADASKPEQLMQLKLRLGELIEEAGGCAVRSGRLFYLALAPRLFGPVVQALAHHEMLTCPPEAEEGWRRVVVEKPFGTDLASARELNQQLRTHLREDQIFRIDHYLGKETVQNILSLRFQNAIFEPLWNRNHVESVEITVAETVAMEGRRGAYYDKAGATRDMVQNHLLQVLALVAMEPPGSLQADAIRSEKVKVLSALRPFSPQRAATDIVRGQYVAGPARDRGYLEESGVAPDSHTETYVAFRAYLDTWRWSGVPFLVRTGKAMNRRFSEVVLRFRTPPVDLLHGPVPDDVCALRPNALRLMLQPHEGVKLGFLVKEPGPGMNMRPAELGFDYADLGTATPPAYQRLLLDALEGQATLFIRGDEVEAAWTFVDSMRAAWKEAGVEPVPYPAGSSGPAVADGLFRGCEGIWTA